MLSNLPKVTQPVTDMVSNQVAWLQDLSWEEQYWGEDGVTEEADRADETWPALDFLRIFSKVESLSMTYPPRVGLKTQEASGERKSVFVEGIFYQQQQSSYCLEEGSKYTQEETGSYTRSRAGREDRKLHD